MVLTFVFCKVFNYKDSNFSCSLGTPSPVTMAHDLVWWFLLTALNACLCKGDPPVSEASLMLAGLHFQKSPCTISYRGKINRDL